ncbi:hypothetical protein Tco_1413710, partial [Tanacetum coccineum]
GYTTATDLLKAITLVVNLWLAGRCPSILAEFLASPSFTHLLKLDNEIRPIAVGTIWRRLVSKVAMKVDFSNAFNLMDRSALLHEVKGLFPVDIRRPSLGVKLLNGALHDLQSELLLLRSCMGLRRSIKNMVVYERPFFGYLQWRLASLPIQFGGLGFGICGMDDDYVSALNCLRDTIPSFDFSCFTNKNTAPSKAQQTLVSALFGKLVKDREVHFDMTVRQKAVFQCLRAPHAQDFLLAIPIDGLGQHMSSMEYRTILKYHLMISLFPVDEICPVWPKACLDTFGEHAVHCKELPGFKYRHDMVRNVLFDVCRRAKISAKKEAPVNF